MTKHSNCPLPPSNRLFFGLPAMPSLAPLVTLPVSDKENEDGLKQLFAKQKGKRRKSSSGLRAASAENGKRAAIPLLDQPDRPASGSPTAPAPAPAVGAVESHSPTATLLQGFSALDVADASSEGASRPAPTVPGSTSYAAWLLRRAVLSVDAELPGAMWQPLRRALLDLCLLQARFGDQEAGRLLKESSSPQSRELPRASARVVRFQPADGSHLEPPAWGRDPPPESAESIARIEIVDSLATVVRAQAEWLQAHSTTGALHRPRQGACELVAESPGPTKRSRRSDAGSASHAPTATLIDVCDVSPTPTALTSSAAALADSLRRALTSARAEAEALLLSSMFHSPPAQQRSGGRKSFGGAQRSVDRAAVDRERGRARASANLLDEELTSLAAGQPMMRTLLSSLVSSCIRQQLRRVLEGDRARNARLLDGLPRGRAIGFLAKCDSSAKVLSCALYEARQLGPMLREPTLRHLLTVSEDEARDALAELPQPVIDDLMTLNESHAALRHLLIDGTSAPAQDEEGWTELRRLIEIARESGCEDEAHFFPLEQLPALRASLLAHQNAVPSLVRYLPWVASPQHPLNQRTRAKAGSTPMPGSSPMAGATPGGLYVAHLVEQLKCSTPSPMQSPFKLRSSPSPFE